MNLAAKDRELVTQDDDLEFFERRWPKSKTDQLQDALKRDVANRQHGTSSEIAKRAAILLGPDLNTVQAVRAFSHHYHGERPHQGLDNELIAPTATAIGTGRIICRERLGGLLKFYYREAA